MSKILKRNTLSKLYAHLCPCSPHTVLIVLARARARVCVCVFTLTNFEPNNYITQSLINILQL